MRKIREWLWISSFLMCLASTAWAQTQLTVVEMAKTNVACNGACNGSIQLYATPLSGPFTVKLNNGALQTFSTAPFTLNNLCAGGYGVEIKDINTNATGFYQFSITQPAPLVVETKGAGNLCTFTPNTCVLAQVSGGTPPYTYQWMNGSTQQEVCGVTSYSVTVTDANGCSATKQGMAMDLVMNLTGMGQNSTCTGCNNGKVSVQVTGGVAPYDYSLNGGAFVSNGANFYSFENLAPGTYTVTVKDSQANPCQKTYTVTITEVNADPLTLTGQVTNAGCAPTQLGGVTLTAAGGFPPYQYVLNGGTPQTSNVFNGLQPGTYVAEVIDDAPQSTSFSFTVTSPAQVVVTATATNVQCNGGGNGNIFAVASGGVSNNYTFTLQGATGGFPTLTNTTGAFSNLPAGVYTVSAANTGTGCSSNQYTVQITQPNPFTVKDSLIKPTCGAANGTIYLYDAAGGTAPYQYAWTGPNGFTATGSFIQNVAAGTYNVTIYDNNQCQYSKTFNLTCNTTPNPLVLTGTSTPDDCGPNNTGSITLTAAGGVTPYQFSLNNGPFQTTGNFTGLTAGTYVAKVKDANGQTADFTVIVGQAQGFSATIVKTGNVCTFTGNSCLKAEVSPAQAGTLTYQWTKGTNPTVIGTTQTLCNLTAGTVYKVKVTGANGCTAVADITAGTGYLTATGATQPATCQTCPNGSVTITASGGTPPYAYSNINTGGPQTTGNYTNVLPGAYNVTVTDANQCTVSVAVTVGVASPLALTGTVTQPGCNTTYYPYGSVTLAATGGTSPYQYKMGNGSFQSSPTFDWQPVGTHIATVKDATGQTATFSFTIVPNPNAMNVTIQKSANSSCEFSPNACFEAMVTGGQPPYTYLWSSGGTQKTVCNLNVWDLYSVKVTDANGCSFQTGYNANPNETFLNAYYDEYTGVSCSTTGYLGTATFLTYGGVPPYSATLSNGATIGQIYNASISFSQLAAGTYTAVITDSTGCSISVNAVMKDTCANGNLVLTGVVTQPTTCNGTGIVDLVASGGQSPYLFSVDNGSFGTNAAFTGLAAGNHVGHVKDANGLTATYAFTIAAPGAAFASQFVMRQACDTVGGITMFYNNDIGAPFVYSVNFGGTVIKSGTLQGYEGFYVDNQSPGTYITTITSSTNCTMVFTAEIIDSCATTGTLTASVDFKTDVLCNGQSNGTVKIVATGGISPYIFKLQTPNGTVKTSANGFFDGLAAGNYIATVQDANGQTVTLTVVVGQPAPLAVADQVQQPGCTTNTGAISLTVTGGTPPYAFSWNGPNGFTSNSANINNLVPGTYVVNIFDDKQCTVQKTFTIAPVGTTPITVSSNLPNLQICVGGSLTLTASGATSYVWQPNATPVNATGSSVSVSPSQTTTYTVTGTVNGGCASSATITVTVNPAPFVTAAPQNAVICAGQSVTLNATGNGNLQTIHWSPAAGLNTTTGMTVIASPTVSTHYLVKIEGIGGGCVAYDTVFVEVTPNVNILTSSQSPSCGQSNGTIATNVTGGVAPYSYLWSNGETTANLSGLDAGTYTLTVTSGNGCTAEKVVNLSNNAQWEITGVATTAGCTTAGGAVNVTIINATPNFSFTYLWSNGATTQDLNGVPAGTYTVTVTDQSGCLRIRTFVVSGGSQAALTSSVVPATCATCNNGAFSVTATGGTAPYNFQMNGATNNTGSFGNLLPGTYVVTVVDSGGCSQNYTVVVPVGQSGALSGQIVSTSNVSCNGAANGKIKVEGIGGVPPYQYSLNGGAFQNGGEFNNLAPGTYVIKIKDANGSIFNLTATVTQPQPIQIALAVNEVSCQGGLDGVVLSTVGGGTPPYTFVWSTGAQAPNLFGVGAGTYNLKVQDANGCMADKSVQVTVNANPDCVWPGDANSDGVANNLDVYALGYAYGSNGPARSAATTNWTGQAAFNWQGFLPSGVNFKHTDANGNGVVDSTDFDVVTLNYGLTHNKTNQTNEDGPEIFFVAESDTVEAGSAVSIQVHVGTETNPALDIYTVAFEMFYDAQPVVQNSASVNTNGSWFGQRGVDQYHIFKDFYTESRLDVGVSRINQMPISGSGRLCNVDIVIDNISGKETEAYIPLQLNVTSAIGYAFDGTEIPLAVRTKTIYIRATSTGRNELAAMESRVTLYPNPTKGEVNLSFPGVKVSKVEIVDMLGRVIATATPTGETATLNLENQPSGLYQTVVYTPAGKVVKPVVVK